MTLNHAYQLHCLNELVCAVVLSIKTPHRSILVSGEKKEIRLLAPLYVSSSVESIFRARTSFWEVKSVFAFRVRLQNSKFGFSNRRRRGVGMLNINLAQSPFKAEWHSGHVSGQYVRRTHVSCIP